MIIIDSAGCFDRALLDYHMTRLRDLLKAMERLRDGGHPTAEELHDGASIDQWTLTARGVPCLRGLIQNHPRVSQLAPTVTSDLWLIAPTLGYARTLSRYYSLGLREGERSETRQ